MARIFFHFLQSFLRHGFPYNSISLSNRLPPKGLNAPQAPEPFAFLSIVWYHMFALEKRGTQPLSRLQILTSKGDVRGNDREDKIRQTV